MAKEHAASEGLHIASAVKLLSEYIAALMTLVVEGSWIAGRWYTLE